MARRTVPTASRVLPVSSVEDGRFVAICLERIPLGRSASAVVPAPAGLCRLGFVGLLLGTSSAGYLNAELN